MFEKIKNLLFKNATTRQTVARNTFWLTMTSIGGRLLRAVIVIYATRTLGPTQWGIFSYAISLTAFLTIFIDFGMGSILTREISKTKDPEERARMLSTSTFLKLALLALGIIVTLIYNALLPDTNAIKIIFPLAICIMAFDTMREFGSSLIHALEKMEWETGLFFLTNTAIVAFGFIFLYLHPTVRSFAFSYAVGTFLGATATAFVLREHFKNLFSNFTASKIKPILASAWPFAVSNALGLLLTNTDILVIGWFKSTTDVGIYAAGLRIIQVLYVLPSIIATSTLPTLARFAKNNNEGARKILEKTIGIAFLIAIPTALGGAILGPQLIGFVYGGGYILGALSFQILILTMIVDFPASILSGAMFAYDRQKNLIWYSVIGGGLNVALDLLFIPRFGIVGSAWATFIAQIISNAYLWYAMNKVNYFTALPRIKKIVVASILMAGLAWLLAAAGMQVLVAIALSVFFYFALLVLLKEPLLEEMRHIIMPKGDMAVADVP